MATVPGLFTLKDLYCQSRLKKLNYENYIKMKNKPDPALL
jgi:hypothetical protein